MNNTREFEVVYRALDTPDNPVDCAVIVGRARQAMAESRHVRCAPAPVFLTRTAGGAAFSVRSSSLAALTALPQSYGSAIGHFGLFERGSIAAAR